jgi:hypothetical protein
VERAERRKDGLHVIYYFQRRIAESEPWEWLLAPQRINTVSDSAKTALRRTLDAETSIGWHSRIQQLMIAVADYHSRLRPPIVLRDVEDPGEIVWRARPVLEDREFSVIFADPDTGKSMLALALAVSCAIGRSVIPGVTIEGPCGTVYLDWESNERTHRRRLGMICKGAGVEMPGNIYYLPMTAPLPDCIQDVIQWTANLDFGLVLIDSISLAAGGDLNDNTVGQTLNGAVRALGTETTTFAVAHPPKDKEKRSVFGSQLFTAGPRAIWEMTKSQEMDSSESLLGLFNRKSNNDRRHRDIGLRVEYSPSPVADSIRYYPADPHTAPGISDSASLIDRLLAELRQGKATVKTLADELQEKEASVRTALRREYSRGGSARVVRLGEGREPEWGLRDMSRVVAQLSRPGGHATDPPLKGRGSVVALNTPRSGEGKEIRMPYKETETDTPTPQGKEPGMSIDPDSRLTPEEEAAAQEIERMHGGAR